MCLMEQRQNEHEAVIALKSDGPEEEGRQGEQVPAEAEGKDQQAQDPDGPHGHGLDITGGGRVN